MSQQSSEYNYPASYLDLISRPDLPNIEPSWFLVETESLRVWWTKTLRQLYPKHSLVPFAKDGGSDDIACFDGADLSGAPEVLLIHAYASPGWELCHVYNSFDEWLKHAEAESAEFRADSE